MILVTGATGHLGGATIDSLLQKNTPANQIAALVRDPKKAEALAAKGITLKTGDYHNVPALQQAFEGVDTLVFVSSGDIVGRVQQHLNVIEAAKAAGVKHIIYTSVVKVNDHLKFFPGVDHFHTEEALKKSDIAYTFFRNTFYIDVLPLLLGGALQTGQWYYAAGDAKANFAARTDMAEALANVALEPAQHANKIYEITGQQAYTFAELAGIISQVTGKPVTYVPIPLQALKDGMKQHGVPEAHIPMYASIAEGISLGELDATDSALETLLKRKPLTLNEYLPKLLGA